MAKYTARKSKLAALNWLCVLFCWLIVPIFIQIYLFLRAHCYTLEFYTDKVVVKTGVLNKQEQQSVFLGVLSVSLHQSLFGRMFSYGDLQVNVPGAWDIDTTGIADPKGLRTYLESRITAQGAHFYEQA